MAIYKTRKVPTYKARMLAMADRLFTEFDELPVSCVFNAISTARAAVKERHSSPVPDPDRVERLARAQLRQQPEPA